MSNRQDPKTLKKQKDLDSHRKKQSYNEQYSFKHKHLESQHQQHLDSFNRQHLDSCNSNTYAASEKDSRVDLHLKFASIFEELKTIDEQQIIELFLQQLEDHEKTRTQMVTIERTNKRLQDQIQELKVLLLKKRQSIAQLCLTESRHLSQIEQFQSKSKNPYFSSEGHYHRRYKELQQYMQEYICSSGETQEEIYRNYKVTKSQNYRLLQEVHQYGKNGFRLQKEIQIFGGKIQTLERSMELGFEKEANMAGTIENLQEQVRHLSFQNQTLQQEVSQGLQMKDELSEENRELSCELDAIKEQMSESLTIKKDIMSQIEQHSEQQYSLMQQVQQMREERDIAQRQSKQTLEILSKTSKEFKQLQNVGKQLQRDISQLEKDKQTLTHQLKELNTVYKHLNKELNNTQQQYDTISTENEHLQTQNSQLKEQLTQLSQGYSQLQQSYQKQRDSKESIRQELMILAGQVRFMEHTYKKEITMNQKVKTQLQNYWNQRQLSLCQVSPNISQEYSPKFPGQSSRIHVNSSIHPDTSSQPSF